MFQDKTLIERWNVIKFKLKCMFAKPERHVLTDDEMIDESLEETFPASDPPGYRSKTHRDKELHGPSARH